MPNLIQRITGDLTSAESDQKIALHGFLAAINELRLDKITQGEFNNYFDMTTAQKNQAGALKDLIIASPSKSRILRVFKDWMYLGELDYDPKYRTMADVNQRLQDEVTDQGGTLP
jgi:hypothetical protein